MRTVLFVVALAALGGCSKKSSKEGLPPATEWNATPGGATGSDPTAGMPPAPGTVPSPKGTAAGGNPHEGLGIPPPNDDGDPAAGPMGGPAGTGAGDHPPVLQAEPTAPHTLEKLPDNRVALGPFSLVVPPGWTEKPMTTSMRSGDFLIGDDAELIVFNFGPTGAGSIDDNLNRWVGQFTQPDGKASKDVAKVEQATFAGQAATLLSVSGRFQAMAMPGASDAVDKADQAMLGMIIASPSGPYYWKLVGKKATIDANVGKWKQLLASLKLK